MKINELIAKRYSSVSFSSEEIAPEIIHQLIEAASWSASARNEQPWRFIIGMKGKDRFYQRIYESLAETNQLWAVHAPVLIVTLARMAYEYQGRPNHYAWHDVGLATSNLLLQATDFGLRTHPMGGFDKNYITEQFDLPEIYEPVTVIALGRAGKTENLPEELQNREKKERRRREFNELVYSGSSDFWRR